MRIGMMDMFKAGVALMKGEPQFNPMGWTCNCPKGAQEVNYAYLEERNYLFKLNGKAEYDDVRILVTARSPADAYDKALMTARRLVYLRESAE